MTKSKILVLGGDKRLDYVYDILTKKQRCCLRVNDIIENFSDIIKSVDYVILPVPTCNKNGYIYSENKNFSLSCAEFSEALSVKNIVFGCNISKELKYYMNKKNIVYHDLNVSEEFLTYNAYLTAQSVLRLMLERTQELITDKKMLITGFGRVAKATAITFKSFIPDITICARRSEQINEAQCLGFKTITYDKLCTEVSDKDYILNTVPEKVFDENIIRLFSDETEYFELASPPYGADHNDFIEFNKNYILASGLPGKFTPRSAGEKIVEIIEKLI